MLFLKYLEDLESERTLEAQMTGEVFRPLFEEQYRWSEWATPKTTYGKPDLDKTRIGSELVDFVNNSLMPYLRGIAEKTTDVNSIEAKIGQIFTEVCKKFGKGDMLQDDTDGICELKVGTQDPKSKPSDSMRHASGIWGTLVRMEDSITLLGHSLET